MDTYLIFFSPLTWITIGASTIYILYKYGTSNFNYFSDQGIPGPKPLPFIGNMWGIWKVNIPKHDRALVKKYGKTFGHFDGQFQNLWTSDAELIRSVFIKDFDHFINRRTVINVKSKVFRKMLLIIHNQEWKDVRSAVTPAFTSGKIKMMSVIVQECANHLADKLTDIAKKQGKLDVKNEFCTFTMTVIARCAFGMTIENFEEQGDTFIESAKKVFSPPSIKSPLIILPFVFPKLLSYFGEAMFSHKGFNFFIDILKNMVKERAELSDVKFNDFVELATEAIKECTKEVDGKKVPSWDIEEVNEIVIAQSLLFFLAGFDTTAITLTNSCFLLAKNPDVQQKLCEEIITKLDEYGDINHDMILDFPYVDNVIHEVLRMNSPVPRVERECNKSVSYNGIHIEKGTIVSVPIYALHYDEEYYPEPETFNPDRWSAENKANMNPNAYLPFGIGPRNCVGMRFAMEEIKIALCTIVKNFRFFPVAETPEEIQFEDGLVAVVQPVNFVVGIELRQK